MLNVYKIKKGLDINLVGEASRVTKTLSTTSLFAIRPDDFYGITPKLLVKEGDKVDIGSPLFIDKMTETIKVVSPVSGKILKIERGDRRKILYIHIESDGLYTHTQYNLIEKNSTKEEIIKVLLDVGLFSFIKQRPYDVIANPNDNPKGIFISAFNKMPLSADFSYTILGQENDFKVGLEVLKKLAPVYVGITSEQEKEKFVNIVKDVVELNIFDGPNPSGNVGVQINKISPINKGEIAWTIKPEEVLFIGRFVNSQKLDFTKTIALAGSELDSTNYIKCLYGTLLEDILKGRIKSNTNIRIIDGNPLVGQKVNYSDFLGAHTCEVCVLPEGDDVYETFGWILPRFKQFSTSRSYFSWLFKDRKYRLDCRIKGGKRHMIMSSEYDRVFPMDIFPEFLIKAIITGNIDRQEELGIYEVAPEDFALPEFVDSSKLELQRIVREGLDYLRKENA